MGHILANNSIEYNLIPPLEALPAYRLCLEEAAVGSCCCSLPSGRDKEQEEIDDKDWTSPRNLNPLMSMKEFEEVCAPFPL